MIESRIKKCWIKFVPPEPPLVGFELDAENLERFRPLLGKDLKDYVVTVKKKTAKSKNMRNYMWALCDEIAQRQRDFRSWTKEDVYRMAVRDVGLWNDVKVANTQTKDLINDWQLNGIGWFAEVVFRGKDETTLRLYRGASVYDSDALWRLTNYVVDMAHEVGIETISDEELKRLKELW